MTLLDWISLVLIVLFLSFMTYATINEKKNFNKSAGSGSVFDELNRDDLESRNHQSKRVYLHLSSGVEYLEFLYYDDNNNPVIERYATQCKILECSADGTVIRESWGKPGDCNVYVRIRKYGGFLGT